MSGGVTVEQTETTDTADNVDDPSHKGINFFGNDLTKIPCMRSSLLNGYIGAIVGGLAGFFYTSKIRIGCHSALVSYWVVATGSWVVCRYKRHKEQKIWDDIIQTTNEKRVKKNEYNLPAAVVKLNKGPNSSDEKPVENS